MKSEGNRHLKQHTRKRRISCAGLLAALILTLVIVVGAGAVYLEFTWQTKSSDRAAVAPAGLPAQLTPAPPDTATESQAAQPASQPTGTALSTGRVTVLLLGTDSRPNEPVGRTDTMMVLTVDSQTHAAGIISLARDLLVPLPGYTNDAKINSAHVLGEVYKYPGGGPALARATVASFIGHPIDYYVRLDFDGFRQIIDQMGGINIDVPKAINDPLYPDNNYGYDPLYIPAGHIHMDGTLALKYARTRHEDSDYGRARRQQQVVLAIKQKLSQPGQLAPLLPRLPGLMLTLAKSVQTDMPLDKMLWLAGELNQVDVAKPVQVVVDDAMGVNSSDATWGFVLIPDMQKVKRAVAGVYDGTSARAPGNAAPSADLVASGVDSAASGAAPQPASAGTRIAVLNGTHDASLASRVAGNLASEGFDVVALGKADRSDYTASWLITFGNAPAATRDALVQQLAIPSDHVLTKTGPGSADLVIVLGADAAASANRR
jgi:LCP family protein required for cell wall assembly